MAFCDSQSLSTSNLTISLVTGNHMGRAILWSNDDTLIFTSNGPHVLIFDTESGSILHRLTRHVDDVVALTLNPTNSLQLLSTSVDGVTHAWDIHDFTHLFSIDFKRKIHSFTSNKVNTYLLFGNGDTVKFTTKIFLNQGQEKLQKYINARTLVFSSRNSCCLLLYTRGDEDYLITYNQKNLIVFSTHSQELHCYEKSHAISCIAVSSNAPTLAFGNTAGRIFIWHNFISGKESLTRLHWHAHSVLSLGFSSDGSYLLSGGEESVLVVWQVDTLKRQFRPRIGAKIRRIASSNTDKFISTVTSDNVMKVLNSSNLELAFISQNLKYTPWPYGLTACHNLDSLVLHSSPPGWVQVYQPLTQTRQFEIDVTALNVVSRPQLAELNYMLVTHLAVSVDGAWMVTCESRYDKREAFRELRLRFWEYNAADKSYDQITCVDRPHSAVNMLSFSPLASEPMCASCGEEGNFRLWTLAMQREDAKSPQPSRLWECYCSNSVSDSRASHCVFSSDASLLAVGHKTLVSLWETETLDHKQDLLSDKLTDYVRSLVWGRCGRDSFVLAATEQSVIAWDILTYSVKWSAAVDNPILCATPYTPYVVAVNEENIYVFDPFSEDPVVKLETDVDSKVIDACFLGRDGSLGVYFITEKQQIYCMHDADKFNFKTNNSTPTKSYSLFTDLLVGPSYTPYTMDSGQLFKKADLSVFDTPCHILPPTKSYAWSVISSLLERESSVQEEEIEPKIDTVEEIEVDSIRSKEVERIGEENMNGDDSESIGLDFSWLDSFFRSSEFVLS